MDSVESLAADIRRTLGVSKDRATELARQSLVAADDLASFKGPLDGLTKDERIEEIGEMMAADRISFANLQQVSRDTLRGMYGPC